MQFGSLAECCLINVSGHRILGSVSHKRMHTLWDECSHEVQVTHQGESREP